MLIECSLNISQKVGGKWFGIVLAKSDVTVRPIRVFRFDNWVTVVFTLVIAIWSMFMLDVWTRTLRTYQTRWGLNSKFESNRPRTHFKGNAWLGLAPKRSETDELEQQTKGTILYYDTLGLVLIRYFAAISMVVTMTAMLVIVYIAITVFRVFARIKFSAVYDNDLIGSLLASLVASIFNLIFILALNDVYKWCAVKLTQWENHRTRAGHERALIWKVFWFQFVNTNAALFYVAVIKPGYESIRCSSSPIVSGNPWPEPCASYGCRLELSLELLVIMVGKQWMQNQMEAHLPKLGTWWTKRMAPKESTEDLKEPLLPWEDDFKNLAAIPDMDTFEDFLELALQFGFCTMYVSAFTLAPIFALINNVYEKEVDSNKMLRTFRRTVPYYASGIGVWEDILKTISVVGIIMQGLVLACTSELVPIIIFQGYFANVTYPLTGNWPDGQYGGGTATYITASYHYNPEYQCSTKSFCKPPANDPDGDIRYTEYAYYLLVGRLVLFLAFEHTVFILKLSVTSFLPPIPMSLRRHKEVQNTVIEKVINMTIYHGKEHPNDTSPDEDCDSDTSTGSPRTPPLNRLSPLKNWSQSLPNRPSPSQSPPRRPPSPLSKRPPQQAITEEVASPDPILAADTEAGTHQASEGLSSSVPAVSMVDVDKAASLVTAAGQTASVQVTTI